MQRSSIFAVPAGAGAYAPTVIYLRPDNNDGLMDTVLELQALLSGVVPVGAQVEVDLLKPGGTPTKDADWRKNIITYNAAGLQAIVGLASWHGVRLRAKSGGNAGDLTVDVVWTPRGSW